MAITSTTARAAALLVVGASRSAAQAPADTARADSARVLRPVEVRASIAPTAGAAVGSGVPARVTVLDGAALRAWEPRLLPDALGALPGVSLYDDLGSPWKVNLSTRGFSAGPTVGLPPGVSVFLDGVRQNEPSAQEVNFDLLPLQHVERVELLSGSASLLGPNSLGGAINLVTARGSGRPSGELELSGGSFGQASAEASWRGRSASGIDHLAGVAWERERGWRDATGARTYHGFANVGRGGATRGVTLQAFASGSRAETAGSLPESLFRASPRANFTAGDFEDLQAQQVALSGHAPVGAGRGALTLYARRSSAERFNVNQAPDPDVRSRTANLTLGGTADWRWAPPVAAGTLALRLGADANASRVRARILGESAGEAELTTDVRSPSLDLAGYALADWEVGRVTLSGGGRYDFVRVPFRNLLRTYDNTTNDYRALSPRLGAAVALARGASVHASVGRSFRAPAILELGCADPEAACPLPFALGDDPPLAPVRATTYEVGGQLARGAVVATASAYRTEVRDEIFFVASEGALLAGHFTNLDRTRRDGVELGVRGAAARGRLAWYGGYAWTRATFRTPAALFSIRGDDDFEGRPLAGDNDVEAGDRLPLVPDHQVKGGGSLRLAGGVSAGLDARYVGRRWLRGDEANVTAPLGGYAVADLRVGVERGAWEVAGIVTNALDRRDATFGTFNENRRTGELERFLTPLNGRGVRLVLRRRLGAAASDQS
ncbi:TonB-dependent receptor [Roseisolibacter sp. H3M3-2]|uniref:TonB-dependent receptor n=1 Tax=Roseisolibacter sp. H3M3-2 TaxID=3031323 RepID=UPI0023DBDE82|nr:TonB-dependent receptor [Roseisolibacter sp. H3M3-2]MDF1501580.1 TonB-dependent receptor [Roseisolibacter sp. H3M3-2]